MGLWATGGSVWVCGLQVAGVANLDNYVCTCGCCLFMATIILFFSA